MEYKNPHSIFLEQVDFEEIIGRVFKKVELDKDENFIVFVSDDNVYYLCHEQDCCEDVYIESVVGDLQDLVNTPIINASESCSNVDSENYNSVSATWSFYHFATIKGYVDVRFYGESNGYYSEDANLYIQGKLN